MESSRNKKRKEMDIKLKQMYWFLGEKSSFSIENKLLLYKVIIKPIWTYGIELWGYSSKSNVNIIQRFQSKTLRMIAGAPWYVLNQTLNTDLRIATVEDERLKRVDKHFQRLQKHENQLAKNKVHKPCVLSHTAIRTGHRKVDMGGGEQTTLV
jgi:hypothetical protein